MLGEGRLQRCWGGLGGTSAAGAGGGGRKETDRNPWLCALNRLLPVKVDLGSSCEVPACLGLGIPSGVKFLDSSPSSCGQQHHHKHCTNYDHKYLQIVHLLFIDYTIE